MDCKKDIKRGFSNSQISNANLRNAYRRARSRRNSPNIRIRFAESESEKSDVVGRLVGEGTLRFTPDNPSEVIKMNWFLTLFISMYVLDLLCRAKLSSRRCASSWNKFFITAVIYKYVAPSLIE